MLLKQEETLDLSGTILFATKYLQQQDSACATGSE